MIARSWRLWTGRRRSDALSALYCLVMVMVGLVGLGFGGTPSTALVEGLGWVTGIYSVGMIGAGFQGAMSVLFRWRRSEVVALVSVGLLSFLHAILIFLIWDDFTQVAWRIVGSGIGAIALASARWEQGITRLDIEEYVTSLTEDTADE